MNVKRICAAVAATAGITAGLATLAAPAHAEDITCYEVGFDHLPNAWVQANPPRVILDDGDPYIRSYPCNQ